MERGNHDPLLITTKLAIPPLYLKKIISRTHAYTALDSGLQRPLTLITAPAGFGKTTLVSEWIRRRQLAAAWVSLEPGDNSVQRFWCYILTALGQLHPDLQQLGEYWQKEQHPPDIENMLTQLINTTMALAQDTVLVLDDYHTISLPEIQQTLTFLLKHLPPCLHIILITRREPALPLARFRVQGKLTELRTNDLRFTEEEASLFLLQTMNLTLRPEDVLELRKRTEGWIAGLQLAALSLQERGSYTSIAQFIKTFSGLNRNVLNYLTDEVLQHLPEKVQNFLLQTSVLERLTASLCDAVTDTTESEAVLEWLEQNNLFLNALDNQQRWYRYDQLFLELLRYRLKQKYEALLPTLHRRAGLWYEQHGMDIEVIQHALLAEDMQWAAQLIERHAWNFIQNGEEFQVHSWLAHLPENTVSSRPMLAFLHAYTSFLQGEMDAYEQWLAQAEQVWQQEQNTQLLSGVCDLRARVALARGNGQQALQFAQQALAHLEKDTDSPFYCCALVHLGAGALLQGDLIQANHYLTEGYRLSHKYGYIPTALTAALYRGMLQKQQGNLRGALQTFQQIYAETGVGFLWSTATAHIQLADLYLEWNDLSTALAHMHQAQQLSQQLPTEDFKAADRYLVQARLAWLQEEHEQALTYLDQAEQSSQIFGPNPTFLARIVELRLQFLLQQKDHKAARQWLIQYTPSLTAATSNAEKEYWIMAQARLFITQSQGQAAIQLLETAYQDSYEHGHVKSQISLLTLLTLAYHSEGNTQATMQKLEQVLLLAEPGGYIRVFIDEGPIMAALLTELYSRYQRHTSADTTTVSLGYLYTLLSSFGTEAQPPRWLVSQDNDDELIDKLSEREYMVLGLIAEGLSNQEIAQKLVVTVSTIKTHLNNIYAKLHVHTRLQAVTRAYDIGVLRRSEVDTEPLAHPRITQHLP
ncbi:LuxR family transcriptional regulator [Dictyobacter vulcani]|uniref:LuxR family transcriptional regulator n=1 Tax=Dictyobacter vulcani TaxID=2607529 RepID=A0A5J4KFJ3_9CHLR|nr:LuxR C-terminal-related transcriptional regulator [Dictyobacter vulcani]GER88154.1 LuxR family transcriptional regulator [Dictyobacter vulcani]